MRDVHVKMTVGEGKGKKALTKSEDFRVLGIYTNCYSKRYMCEKGEQAWSEGMDEGNNRFMLGWRGLIMDLV